MDAVNAPHDVDVEETLFVLELLFFEFANNGNTRVVNENVEATAGVLHKVFNGAFKILGVRDVHFSLYNIRIVLSPVKVSRAGVGTNKVAFFGESFSNVTADATSSTGNKYGFLSHIFPIVVVLRCVTYSHFRYRRIYEVYSL